ncbi:MAG: SDR family oxidoreductase, partial [Caulobacteraceae bacterium]|nr:SDR family oxidoreductase [Caulobacteraceae bacterium]
GAWARLNPGGSASSSRTMESNPMGRVGEMRELANLAVYLLHPLSEYVNGQTIAIDGGAWNAGGGGFQDLRGWTDEQWSEARAMIRGANEQDRAKRTV